MNNRASRWDSEEYVENTFSNNGDINIIIDLISPKGLPFTLFADIIKANKKNTIKANFRFDTAAHPSRFNEIYTETKYQEAITNLYNSLEKEVEEIGFKLTYSHNQTDEFWGWSDIEVDLSKITLQNINDICRVTDNHYTKVSEITDAFEKEMLN